MSILVWAVTAALVATVLVVSAGAAVVGLVGVLCGEELERCPRCHRYDLLLNGELHEDGCHGLHEELARIGRREPHTTTSVSVTNAAGPTWSGAGGPWRFHHDVGRFAPAGFTELDQCDVTTPN